MPKTAKKGRILKGSTQIYSLGTNLIYQKVVNIWLFEEVEVRIKVKVEGLFYRWTKFICKRSKISLKSKKKWGITKKEVYM